MVLYLFYHSISKLAKVEYVVTISGDWIVTLCFYMSAFANDLYTALENNRHVNYFIIVMW